MPTATARPPRRPAAMLLVLMLLTTAAPARAQSQPSPAAPLPVVWVLATGGTIAGQGASPTDLANYRSGSITGQDLVDRIPEVRRIARVSVEQIANVGSSDLTIQDWLKLSARINALFDDPQTAGVVVTHGTDTLEETAYFLSLTVHSDRPVVVVGSMRPATAMSADGPLNLYNAIRVAASPEARGRGALVVLNDEINAAREVTKTNTYRVETFKTPELGLLGYVDADRISFYRQPTRRHTARSEFDVRGLTDLPRVDIVYEYVQPNPAVVRALLADGVKGIVIAGSGAGSVSKFTRAPFEELAKRPGAERPVVVRSSRTGNGRVLNGGESSGGAIGSDTLNPQKARVLLMLALTKTSDPAEIRRMFAEY